MKKNTFKIKGLVLLCLLLGSMFTYAQKHVELMKKTGSVPTFKALQDSMHRYYSDKYQGKGSGYKLWKRYEEWMKYHQNPDGSLGNIGFNSFDAIKTTAAANQRTNINTGNWTSVGPVYNQGTATGIGRTNCIAFHPTNANIVYVGAPIGGIWKGDKTSGSYVWTPLGDGLAGLGVGGIVIHPTNPNIIYILTGDGNRADTYSIGVMVSYDGGYSWQQTGMKFTRTDQHFGYKLLMNPQNPATMYAAFNAGVYRTTNSGADWDIVPGLPGCYDIEYKPQDTTVMYAAGFNSLYTFSGGSWSDKSAYLPAGTRRVAIGVSPADNLKVYVYCGTHDSILVGGNYIASFKGILRSDNSGSTYPLVCNNPNISGYNQDGSSKDGEQSDVDMDICVSRTNANVVYAGTENIWKSSNGAVSFGSNSVSYWNSSGTNYVHEDINFLSVGGDNSIYCGSDGGVYRSTDAGVTWTDIGYGLVISQFYRIAVHQTNNDIIVNGAQDAAQNVRIGATAEFKEVRGGDGMDCMIDEQDANVFYTSYAAVYRTLDGGATSVRINGTLTGNWIVPLAMDYFKSDTIYYGQVSYNAAKQVVSDDVYRSYNKGTNWVNIGGGGSDALAIGRSNTGRLYGNSKGVLMTTANGNAASPVWNNAMGTNYPSAATLATAPISKITVNPANEQEVWFSMGGYDANNKVFRSLDAGANWENMSAGLPNVAALSIIYGNSNGSNPGGVYVGTDIGVFYRNNALGGWIPFRNWLPAVPVWDLKINYSNGMIRAGTYGRGIWESPLYTVCPSSVSLTTYLEGSHYYQSSNSITTQSSIEFGPGTNVQMKAGGYVDIKPGFNAGNGVFFRASIGACGAGIPNKETTSDGLRTKIATDTIPVFQRNFNRPIPASEQQKNEEIRSGNGDLKSED